MNQVDANCYRVESTNATAGGMAQGREESQLGEERPKVQVGPRTRHVEEAFGLMEPHRHQPSPASHHCLYISCTFQKKLSIRAVLLETFLRVQPVQVSMAPSPGSGVGAACDCTEGSQPFGRKHAPLSLA